MSRFADLSGAGAKRASGRWHNAGSPVVYTSETASGALLEHLAYLEVGIGSAPETFTLLRIETPDDAGVLSVQPSDLLRDWKDQPELTRGIGDRWLRAGEFPFLAVPSALCPATWNRLLNPRHTRAGLAAHPARVAVSVSNFVGIASEYPAIGGKITSPSGGSAFNASNRAVRFDA